MIIMGNNLLSLELLHNQLFFNIDFLGKDSFMQHSNTHEQILNFAVATGHLMLKSGAETYRVEDTISRILARHHFRSVNTFVIPTGIMVTIEDETFSLSTKVVRVKNRSTRLDRIEMINQLSRDYVAEKISLEEATSHLERIRTASGYSNPTTIIWIGISCSFLSIMYRAHFLDFFLTFLIGLGMGYLQLRLTQKNIVNFFVLFLVSLYIGFSATLCRYFFKEQITVEPIIIGCIIPLLPGVAFTTAVRDAIGDELISGIARGVEALLVAVAISAGIGISLSLSQWIGGKL